MEEELSYFLNYKIGLEWVNEEGTPTVKKGLEEGSILIYEKIPE